MFVRIFFIAVAVLLTSCSEKKRVQKKIAAIPMEVEITRFDQLFARARPEALPALKADFPYLFPEQYHDSIWVQRMQDTLHAAQRREVNTVFSDFSKQEAEIRSLFQHLKFYFPEFKPPKVVTVISDVDYQNRVIPTDSLLLIGLDNFLGSDHRFYEGIQQFLRRDFESEQLTPAIAEAYAARYVKRPEGRTFLNRIVWFGKILYFKELLLTDFDPHTIVVYTPEEMGWARANEPEIWRYFIENELLYDTDPKLSQRFTDPAPFSKFYLELDNESPGRLGQYIGWQIVRAYMENNDVSIKHLCSVPADELYKRSKFKPRK